MHFTSGSVDELKAGELSLLTCTSLKPLFLFVFVSLHLCCSEGLGHGLCCLQIASFEWLERTLWTLQVTAYKDQGDSPFRQPRDQNKRRLWEPERSWVYKRGCLICSVEVCVALNRLRSIYQYSSMAPRFSGQTVKRLGYKETNTKYRSLSWKPRSHVRIFTYQMLATARLQISFWCLYHFVLKFLRDQKCKV